jgi:phage portal protein BeeE
MGNIFIRTDPAGNIKADKKKSAEKIDGAIAMIIALYPLMANRMRVDRDENGHSYYEYQMSTSDDPTMKAGTVRFTPSDVLHIPGLGFDGLVGYSPIAMAKNSIGMAMATEKYGATFFKSGAEPIRHSVNAWQGYESMGHTPFGYRIEIY